MSDYVSRTNKLKNKLVSRLMGSTAASAANMGHGLNAAGMPTLGACAMPDSKPMQFPLAQRRKRRVLFTQAQVSKPRLFEYWIA